MKTTHEASNHLYVPEPVWEFGSRVGQSQIQP
uniref:Uncharacterized protein n=1 Tax=Ralstonia solanacearum TaxID=305 RepID=A0A0S4UL16_RALSL|nr:protein of unknown function [Ralstonia solanacearum]CUV36802.1 protein of unknown function [Ralstonia solanacearum]CUV40626.1 protein of unknown function [Ralstonia solanacearum]CUV64178.1 protein of unknown function [Ralstonia solanacearum]